MNEHTTPDESTSDIESQEMPSSEETNAADSQGSDDALFEDDQAAGGTSLELELASAKAEIIALKEQLLRKAAEFENFRRRTEERQNDLIRYGSEKLITELLPVVDDFIRSLKAGQDHNDFEPFYKGVELLYNKLLKLLELRGLKPIKAVGEPFDVDFHDALLQIPKADMTPGTIIDEVETGYMLHDKVIRHAKVTVATDPATE